MKYHQRQIRNNLCADVYTVAMLLVELVANQRFKDLSHETIFKHKSAVGRKKGSKTVRFHDCG